MDNMFGNGMFMNDMMGGHGIRMGRGYNPGLQQFL